MLDTIRTYIDGLFVDLPASPEVERARAELLQMSEDKYHQLRESGASDSEATGRVITEFGNLDELADDLGIRGQLDTAAAAPKVPMLGQADVDRALRVGRRSSWLIAGGLFVIFLGLAFTVWFNDIGADALSAIPFLVAVAVAVGMFIVGGQQRRVLGELRDRDARVDPAVAERAKQRRMRGEGGFTAALVIGVGLIILSVALPTTQQALGIDGQVGVIAMFLVLAVGIGVLILAATQRSALAAIEAAGRMPTLAEQREEAQSSLIGMIAAIYWPAVTLVFLAWGFIGNAWGQAWIIFPLAGVGFAVIVGITSLMRSRSGSALGGGGATRV